MVRKNESREILGESVKVRSFHAGDDRSWANNPMVESLEEAPPPVEPISSPDAAGEGSPLLPMTAPRDASSAPKTLLNRPIVIAARKKTTR